MIVAQNTALSIPEVAKQLGVSVSTVRRMIDKKEIAAFKVLGQWRIRQSEVDRIMSGGQVSDDNQEDK